ncbi:hypothetical protein [Amycolatopsis sp. NPDC051372]|uniref:hypothetical protein n=1 Tax=Amycolatopsis sp. NPDC051372 TaxID=3155669 RepID=UPI003419DCEF
MDGVGGTWNWYTRDGVNIPKKEIGEQVERIRARDSGDAKLFLAAVVEQLERAKRGQLVEPDEVKIAMWRARGINEIRWALDSGAWRMYFCEPLRLQRDRVMVALLFGRKVTLDEQDEDIDEANERYAWWGRAANG